MPQPQLRTETTQFWGERSGTEADRAVLVARDGLSGLRAWLPFHSYLSN